MSNQPLAQLAFPRHAMVLMYRMYRYILPDVNRSFDGWRRRAEAIPDAELRKQALASMDTKKFHCQGGASYALASQSKSQRTSLLEWIVAFQTISDYLDNLCDRSTSLSADDFRCLHQAMLDAVDSNRPLHDYYACRDEREDGGYLSDLVRACQHIQSTLPSYTAVEPELKLLVGWYCDLQVYKHIHHDLREQALGEWWQQHRALFSDLEWQEFAAATGSTLGVFCLLGAATLPGLSREAAKAIREAYFPAICGLHILLDYFVDQAEDRAGGDLNFCTYYESDERMVHRIRRMVQMAYEAASSLPNAPFHRMIVDGLLALYLSDSKLSDSSEMRAKADGLLSGGPLRRKFFYWNAGLVRRWF